MLEEKVLVSVGVPVRDGAKTLRLALDSVVNQTYRNLEIIISDNCSTDATQDICLEYAGKDSRIRYVRQEKLLPATENFRFVLEQSHGEYFMWAAHDDLRNDEYISTLLNILVNQPAAILAFGDLYLGTLTDGWEKSEFDFVIFGNSLKHRIRKSVIFAKCHHIYGLWRASVLKKSLFSDIYYGPDIPIMVGLSSQGDFLYGKGAKLYYHRKIFKNPDEIQIYREYTTTQKKEHFMFKLSLATFKNLAHLGHPIYGIYGAFYVYVIRSLYYWLDRGGINWYVFAPNFVKNILRRVRKHFLRQGGKLPS